MSLRKLPDVQAFQRPEWLAFEPPVCNLDAFDPDVISAESEQDGVISIYGQIGIDPMSAVDNTERRITAALRSIGRRDVTVSLNSPGGNFFNGLSIYNVLRTHPAKVTVQIVGMAGSAASIIAMAGDDILMADGSFIMVHAASAQMSGNKFDVRAAADILENVDAGMAEIYAARSGADKARASGWMDHRNGDGTMFGVEAAISAGLANGKLGAASLGVRADAGRTVPVERLAERALISAANMTPAEARAAISSLKSGARDAAPNVTCEADEIRAAIAQLSSTIRS